jgi:peroxiredoxin
MSHPRRPSRVGTPAAPFDLVDANGTRHTLAQYRGRWLWLVFHRHLG